MAFQPSEADIQNFMECAPGMSRQEVIARIKGNSDNVEFAISEYFDDPGSKKYDNTWVDGFFNNDEDGSHRPNNTSFNIHSPDEITPHEIREPQTRPPTPSRRTNSQSPNVIDLTTEHANADARTSAFHNSDADLERAIQESRLTAGLPPQESGITDTDKAAFGPATRSQYEEDQWAMVTVGKNSAEEILPDPEPAARKRDLNVPAFLKPSVNSDNRLGAILTIYHEIPLVREVLLNRLDVQQTYGFEPEWWSGKAVEYSGTIKSNEGQELTYEIQRLMAFLDKTDRSYGSAEIVANLPAVKKARRLAARKGGNLGQGDDLLSGVFDAWKKTFDNRETGQVSKIFSVGVPSEMETDRTEFAIMDFSQPKQNSGIETFYDIADQVLWPQPEDDVTNCAYLSHIADVIAFRLKDDNKPSNNVEIPAVWYPDRYLMSRRQAAFEMRQQKAEVDDELQKITRLQNTLTHVSYNNKNLKVKNMFKAALQHNHANVQDEDNDLPDESFIGEDQALAQASNEKAQKLSDHLNKLVASIDKKLIDLDSQKEKAKETLRKLSKLYTEASSEPDEPPTHNYTLRGVSTTNSTMYIRRKAEIDLIDMGLDNDESPSDGDQWWRIKYSSSGSNPVIVEKSSEEKVLEAAKTESKNIIVVYASEKAMQFESKPLPLQLENFVRQDNQLFFQELTAADDTRSQERHVTSPGKRKFNSQSESSEEANRWNGGISPRGYPSVQVMEKEVSKSDSESDGYRAASQHLIDRTDESRTVTPGEIEPEVIHGVDPALLGNDNTPFGAQEMQERNHMPMISRVATGESSTIDSMDLDQVVEDDNFDGGERCC